MLSRDNIETLELELRFWARNKSVSVSAGGKNYILSRYYVPFGQPRCVGEARLGSAASLPQTGMWSPLGT